MRLRHIKGCEEFVNNHYLTISKPEEKKGECINYLTNKNKEMNRRIRKID